MSEWWWYGLVGVAVLLVTAVVVLRRRPARAGGGSALDPSRNYRDERETARRGGMNAEDRAWETASLERNRQSEAGAHPPHRHGVAGPAGASADAGAEADRRQDERWESEGGAIRSPCEPDDPPPPTPRSGPPR